MEIATALIAFFALVAAWFVLPSEAPARAPRTQTVVTEALPTAA